jgi:glycosyltransferase involved in cell wall biosynthesis
MKSILMIVQNFYPEIGSAANRLKNVYIQLKQSGYEVTVLTMNPSYPNQNLYEDGQFWDEEDIEQDVIRITPSRVKSYTSSVWLRLFHYLETMFLFIITIFRLKKKYEYIFISTPPIFPTVAGLLAKRKMKAKLITDVRDLWPESLLGVGVFTNKKVLNLAYWFEKKLYLASDQIIVNSPIYREYIKAKGVNEQNIRFIPNSLTIEELNLAINRPILPEGKLKVIYTGNIGLAQDILKLLEVAECLQVYRNIEFVIIGYGFRKNEVEAKIKAKGLTNIKLIQAKNRKLTLKEISTAHIAYVSLVEKSVFDKVLPGKIIDYMCVGKPIVADVSGFAAEIIQKVNCGLIAENRSVEEIASHIITLATNRALLDKLGLNGYQYAKEHFCWNNNIEGLRHILEAQ